MSPFRRRRPLVRAAVVGGAAAYGGKKYGERKASGAAREAEEEERLSALEAHDAAAHSRLDELKTLADLRDTGALTEAEFETEKKKILG